MNRIRPNLFLLSVVSIVMAFVSYFYYESPAALRVEQLLYDLRMRIQGMAEGGWGDIVTVGISDADIGAIDQTPVLNGSGASAVTDMSPAGFVTVLRRLAQSEMSRAAIILYPHVTPYNAPGLDTLAEFLQTDPRFVVGLFDISKPVPATAVVPPALAMIGNRVFPVDAFKFRKREVVRTYPILSYQDRNAAQHLPTWLAGFDPQRLQIAALDFTESLVADQGRNEFLLYYPFHPEKPTWSAAQLWDDAVLSALKGKTVIVGYQSYRNWLFQSESTHANTPWEEDGEEVDGGVPYINVLATATSNLVDNTWLKPVHPVVGAFHTLATGTVALLLWRLGPSLAVLGFLGGWILLIILHGMVFRFFHLYLPLADAFLWSTFATIAGGLWRLGVEGRQRAAVEAKAVAQRDIERTQARFLNRFADELGSGNARILDILRDCGLKGGIDGHVLKFYSKLLSSAEEFSEYLAGIHQFAEMEGRRLRRPKREKIDVRQVLEKIIAQFESRISETNLKLEVDGPPLVRAVTDPRFFEPILFNLISNAVKYSPPDGTVRVAIGRGGGGSALRISIKDEGPGIASEFHEKIFEKFYRIKNDDVFRIKGNGLGLYLCRYFALQIGGRITVDSEVGRGSTFTLSVAEG